MFAREVHADTPSRVQTKQVVQGLGLLETWWKRVDGKTCGCWTQSYIGTEVLVAYTYRILSKARLASSMATPQEKAAALKKAKEDFLEVRLVVAMDRFQLHACAYDGRQGREAVEQPGSRQRTRHQVAVGEMRTDGICANMCGSSVRRFCRSSTSTKTIPFVACMDWRSVLRVSLFLLCFGVSECDRQTGRSDALHRKAGELR